MGLDASVSSITMSHRVVSQPSQSPVPHLLTPPSPQPLAATEVAIVWPFPEDHRAEILDL